MLTAVIDPEKCVGCNICVQICPFDAIIGASGQMHTVLLTGCVGCKKCVDPCPVECIKMSILPSELQLNHNAIISVAKRRKTAKNHRINRQEKLKLYKKDQILNNLSVLGIIKD